MHRHPCIGIWSGRTLGTAGCILDADRYHAGPATQRGICLDTCVCGPGALPSIALLTSPYCPSTPVSTPTIASDLQALREARGLSVEQLQQRTRVPTDIIRRLEAGTLLDDSRYSDVYLNAFLKSYAEAVDVPSGAVVTAIAESKHGAYSGSLRQYLSVGKGAAPPSPPKPVEDEPKRRSEPAAPREPATPREPAAPREPGSPAAAAALAQQPEKTPEKKAAPAASVSRAPSRKNRGARSSKSIDKSWGAILGMAGGALAVIAVVLFFLFRDDPEEEQAFQPVRPDTTQAAAAPEPAEEEAPTARTQAPALQLPLQVTLLAQEPLAGFRVTEAPDIRRPYWLEAGASQTFESAEEIVLWGGERGGGYGLMEGVRFRMQGLEWTPRNGVIRITPQNGQALLDSLANLPARPAAPATPATTP